MHVEVAVGTVEAESLSFTGIDQHHPMQCRPGDGLCECESVSEGLTRQRQSVVVGCGKKFRQLSANDVRSSI